MAVPYDTLSNVHRIKSIVVNALFLELAAELGISPASARRRNETQRNQQSAATQGQQGQAQTKPRWKL